MRRAVAGWRHSDAPRRDAARPGTVLTRERIIPGASGSPEAGRRRASGISIASAQGVVVATSGSADATRLAGAFTFVSAFGIWITVALCPSARLVTRTRRPSGNSSASWWTVGRSMSTCRNRATRWGSVRAGAVPKTDSTSTSRSKASSVPGAQADCDVAIFCRGKSACRRVGEPRRYHLVADRCGSRGNAVKTIITHGGTSRWEDLVMCPRDVACCSHARPLADQVPVFCAGL